MEPTIPVIYALQTLSVVEEQQLLVQVALMLFAPLARVPLEIAQDVLQGMVL